MPSEPSKVSTWIPPLLYTNDVPASIDFYKNNLDWEERLSMPSPDGKTLIHTMLGRGEHNILFGQHEEIKYNHPPRAEDTGSDIIFPITNIDDYYKKVQAREGIHIVHRLEDKNWGDRTFTVRDNNGYLITFTEHVRDVCPDEIAPAMQQHKDRQHPEM